VVAHLLIFHHFRKNFAALFKFRWQRCNCVGRVVVDDELAALAFELVVGVGGSVGPQFEEVLQILR
tara:strand:+ start:394 stop:591 length:198 start_codon:yes stop_codon:yes gene_type:complete